MKWSALQLAKRSRSSQRERTATRRLRDDPHTLQDPLAGYGGTTFSWHARGSTHAWTGQTATWHAHAQGQCVGTRLLSGCAVRGPHTNTVTLEHLITIITASDTQQKKLRPKRLCVKAQKSSARRSESLPTYTIQVSPLSRKLLCPVITLEKLIEYMYRVYSTVHVRTVQTVRQY